MTELKGEAEGAVGRARIAESWDGLSEDTQLFLRAACLFDAERIPRDALAALLSVEGWDADLFQIALDDAQCEALIAIDDDRLQVPPELVGFIRNEVAHRLPCDIVWLHLERFCSAAAAVRDRPSDPEVVEGLLAYPLERGAWDPLGSDVDEALSELTPTVARGLLALDREAQALSWYERALPHLQCAAEEVDEKTQHGAGVLTALWDVLFQMGAVVRGDGDDKAALARAYGYFEKAVGVVERLSAVEPKWLASQGMNCTGIADLLLHEERNEEAARWCDRAVEAFEAFRARCGAGASDRVGRLLPLATCLAALDRDAEALVWFDRASAALSTSAPGGGGSWSLAVTALRIGERLFYNVGEERRATALPWLERALAAYANVEVRDAAADVRIGRALTIVGKLHFESAKADQALLPSWAVLPRASIDLAHLAEAHAYFERAAEFAEKAEHLSPEDRCFIGQYAMSMGGFCHHQAGRPAEGIASFERAEALVERLGASARFPVAYRIEALRVRGRCLDMLGEGEQAAVFLQRAVQIALEDATDDAAWEDGDEDFSALDVAEVQAELIELLDKMGAGARAAPQHRAHALLFSAYGFAERDLPEEAARWFDRAETAESQDEERRASRRIVMAAARAVMRAFARADRHGEAISWYRRFFEAYHDRMALDCSSAKGEGESKRALLALCRDDEAFEITLEKQIRGRLRSYRRDFEWADKTIDEPGQSDASEDELDGDELDDDERKERDGAESSAPEHRR